MFFSSHSTRHNEPKSPGLRYLAILASLTGLKTLKDVTTLGKFESSEDVE